MTLYSNDLNNSDGLGSVATAPDLPAGFAETFQDQFLDTGEVRLHAAIGGSGPPILLVHGWPQNWYAWRLLMLPLAEHFTVIAVDQRGIGLSDKPPAGYDTGTLASDLIGLMDALGHDRFSVVGHDTGFAIGYALAADHPRRIACIALAEIPGPPMQSASPPVFVPAAVNNRLWHIPFCRAETLPEQLVKEREDIFFGYEFEIQGGKPSDAAIAYYVSLLSQPDVLPGSFGFYRALDATLAQNETRQTTPLPMPVLAIGGELSYGAHVGEMMQPLAANVQSAVIAGTGHWIAEDAPDATLAVLTAFLTAHSDAAASDQPIQEPAYEAEG